MSNATMNEMFLAAAGRGGRPTSTETARERLSVALGVVESAKRSGDQAELDFAEHRLDRLIDDSRQSRGERPRNADGTFAGTPAVSFDSGVRGRRPFQPGTRSAETSSELLLRSIQAMRARSGISRSVYRCSGRIEYGAGFCSQPGIPRELIDEPLLRHLLDRYVDLEAMRQRIADRANSALTDAHRAVADREAEVAKLERAMDATERAWDEGHIDARQYAKREARLTDELAGARAALDHAQTTAESASNGPTGGDPEQELLDHLAVLKAAVADGVEQAPNLNALRNVLAELFERVELVPDVDGDGFLLLPLLRVGRIGDGRWDYERAGRRTELPLPTNAAPALLVAKP